MSCSISMGTLKSKREKMAAFPGVAMKFKEAASRLTGFSVPLFGVQWNPSEAQCVAARRTMAFLEDRRVLYVPSEMESPEHCMQSVVKIREFLTTELGKLDSSDELALILKPMRAACRKFLATVEEDDRRAIRFGAHQGHFASWIFNGAVGELRGVFGVHIARLAASYGLDIESELATIMPASAECDSTSNRD